MSFSASPPRSRPYSPIQEDDLTAANSADIDMQQSIESDPVCVEGILHCRKGRSSGHASILWKKRFVFLSLVDGGSLTVYKEPPKERQTSLHTVYTMLQSSLASSRGNSHRPSSQDNDVLHEENGAIDIHIPSQLLWVVKDVENDQSNFVVEIETNGPGLERNDSRSSVVSTLSSTNKGFDELTQDSILVTDEASKDDEWIQKVLRPDSDRSRLPDEILDELSNAKHKGKPLRIYFRCSKGRNEKALWLQAFFRLGRLSLEVRRKKSILGSLASPIYQGVNQVRVRRASHSKVAQDVRQLELVDEGVDTESVELLNTNDVEELVRGRDVRMAKDKEYRVQPTYAYPHRWMTRREMRQEMILPSETFHDLRVANCKLKEVGSLKVEVLQCLGLPKLDRTSMTDAIVYLVCGPYAFATDVIPNRANPMWPKKCRRACDFPLHHGFARLYVGVFDDDKKRVKDEFAGRIVIDIARLRPHSTYDVTLPLRLSTDVYSRRQRGAIRLRFTLKWTTERDAMMSYIPSEFHIPLPQNSKPNLSTTVLCADQKAFRNVVITVHGSHMPGKFTFQQMRAVIREINFTRKHILTSIRTWFRDLRHWQYPPMSAFVFLAWMHCVYANTFALVPAYVVLFFFIQLMGNYAKYGIDGPAQRGFIPPSWEELFSALISGGNDTSAIEPLELSMRPLPLVRRRSPELIVESFDEAGPFDYKVTTHVPRGKGLFRALGFLKDRDNEFVSAEEDHLEFPFANGTDYPKFTVKQGLVPKKGETVKDAEVRSNGSTDSLAVATSGNGEVRMIPRLYMDMEMPDILKHMELPDIMRKDSSGLRDFDEEEANFATRHAVVATGKKAALTLTKTATELTELSGLHHVVSPVTQGLSTGMNQMNQVMDPVRHGISKGMKEMKEAMDPVRQGISQGISTGVNQVSKTSYSLRSAYSFSRNSTLDSESEFFGVEPPSYFDRIEMNPSIPEGEGEEDELIVEPIDPLLLPPEQNVDVEGPSTGKKLTEDLAEIKEKVHEMTWNLFNDKLYVVKNPDACFYGQAKRADRGRKADIPKEVDKLMRINQYSHSNPFVARVGMYVEPIIGSAYSFLCLFRAGFNVMTWRDPILTFWLSFFTGILTILLFIFPWRIFLLFLGIMLVGPQNWVLRKLREKGHLPPLPPGGLPRKTVEEEEELENGLPKGKQVFSVSHRQHGKVSTAANNVDPREIQRVVIPYGRLMYQRFYDWPPEPQYAVVKREGSEENRRLLNSSLLSQHNRHHSMNALGAGPTSVSSDENGRMRGHVRRRTYSFTPGAGRPSGITRSRSHTADYPLNGESNKTK